MHRMKQKSMEIDRKFSNIADDFDGTLFSLQDLADFYKVSRSAAYSRLLFMRHKVYVASWVARGNVWMPLYKVGDRNDVPKPSRSRPVPPVEPRSWFTV